MATEINRKRRTLVDKLRWTGMVANRFARVDRNGRSAVTSFLATAGICFGVMALIVVVSVMNGFQMSFKDAIMEVTSYHIRVTKIDQADEDKFLEICSNNSEIISVTPFREAQGLIAGMNGSQSASIIRSVPEDICETDLGFAREISVVAGKFDLSEKRSIVLGASLASSLSVRVGGSVNLLALSGGSDVALLSQDREYTVTGIFRSGYSDINSTYAFINADDGNGEFGSSVDTVYGIKIFHENSDRMIRSVSAKIISQLPDARIESWQSYNRSFFGVLRIEKNILLLFVFLIFVVVAINIYNGMNRLVFERRAEISIFSAIGAPAKEIESLFIVRGFLTGAIGSAAGLVLGLFLSVNSGSVFKFASWIMYSVEYFFMMIINPSYAVFIRENPMYHVYASIPARAVPFEIFLITLFGFFAPLIASFLASRKILSMKISEVLHYE